MDATGGFLPFLSCLKAKKMSRITTQRLGPCHHGAFGHFPLPVTDPVMGQEVCGRGGEDLTEALWGEWHSEKSKNWAEVSGHLPDEESR